MSIPVDHAPELEQLHDQLFSESDGEIYGSADDWTPIQRSGHFRRIEILENLDIGEIQNAVAVDFGSGPWGFGCIFSRLKDAAHCICMDVSSVALEMSKAVDLELSKKTQFMVSDGEKIPLPDNSVDIFWGGEVIEHVREPLVFMQEIARVCRSGAYVMLSTPNRDALYYKAANEINTIGFEHIALMNYQEFSAVVASFCKEFSITGYELSLTPELDHLITDPSLQDLVQRRAAAFPETASGLILHGRIDKSLYEKNRRDWTLKEIPWSEPEVERDLGGQSLALVGSVNGWCLASGSVLSFETEVDRLLLLLWSHPWSGWAEILVEGLEPVRVNLFTRAAGGFRRVVFDTLPKGKRCVSIRHLGEKAEGSMSDQVIFYKAIGYQID
jgi:ubiquinone/menaquinone biosynthesis C-methylase UbiE